jgi:mono/diheme cytochrome c family protein
MSGIQVLKKNVATVAFPAVAIMAVSLLATPAALATTDGDVARGEAAYVENCASCHADPVRIMRRVTGADDAAKAAGLDDFLAGHYAEDPQDRADIVAYLLSL